MLERVRTYQKRQVSVLGRREQNAGNDGDGYDNKMMMVRERQGACLNLYVPTKNGKCWCWAGWSKRQATTVVTVTTT